MGACRRFAPMPPSPQDSFRGWLIRSYDRPNMKHRPLPALAAVFSLAASSALALGQVRYVDFSPSPRALRLAGAGSALAIVVEAGDAPGVARAASDLREDVFRVTGVRPEMRAAVGGGDRELIVAGTLGHSPLIDGLAAAGRIDVRDIRGKWEASLTQVVARPWPGVARALVIAGSDRRGTIFGLYDLSEQIGVSPWYWWADVPVTHREQLHVREGRHVRAPPAVKYRGIFLNDEAPALSGWTKEKFGGFNSRFYVHVFELLLRLRANFLWPAMWGNAFNDDDPESPRLADAYGIVVGTSHHEPLMRAHDEWRRYGTGPWNYAANEAVLRDFWTQSVRRTKAYENIQTLGMRGDGDAPMSREADVALLERIVADQRRIIAAELDPDVTRVPQVWALYKEVQEYYEKGMRVPDDVTLLWCDDNWGNIRRLPTAEERARPGGAGVYYHFDYVGGPRSYKWINVTALPKVWEQMHLAVEHGATRLWIVNVGDLKPMELPIQFFLDYAWDPARWPAESLGGYTRQWAAREFGPDQADEIADIVAAYTRFNARRKPEMLEPRTFSLVHHHEAETVAGEWNALARRAEAVQAALPEAARDAYFQLVLHPVKAGAVLNDLYVTAGLNALYARQGRTSTNALAERARALFAEDASLTRAYNELGGGRWRHLMDQTHIGYTYWNQPPRNAMPGVQEVQVPDAAEMGVAIEGSEGSWPGGPAPTLPVLSVFDGKARTVDVFNRGRQPFDFTVETSAPWLEVEPARGTVGPDTRLQVRARWAEVPIGTERATFTVSGAGAKVMVTVPLLDPPTPRPETLDGFMEAGGFIAIEAEHSSARVAPPGREWKLLPGHGRTLSALTPWPVTETAAPGTMRLEYRVNVLQAGPVTVQAVFSPTQKFRPGPGFRYAVSFDDEEPQVVNVHADESPAAWERSVADGVAVLTSKHTLAAPGAHVLKFWALDPGLVLQRLVVDTGGLKPSYLGPPESAYRIRASAMRSGQSPDRRTSVPAPPSGRR